MPDMGSGSAVEPSTSRGAVRLRTGACLAIQRPGTPCRRCAETCPAKAVDVRERTLEISAEACTGCGRCAAVCPTGALAVDGFARPGVTGQVRIECSRVPTTRRAASDAVVPCLGGLTADQVRTWFVGGADAIVLVDRGWCAGCPVGGIAAPWADALAMIGHELDALHARNKLSIRVDAQPLAQDVALPPPAPRRSESQSLTRRQLFARLSAPRPKAVTPPAIASSRSPSSVSTDALSERRRQLMRLSGGRLPATLFPAVSIADTCCDNRICTRACPTGALHGIEVIGFGGVAFDAALCIACGACETACPTGSIALHTAGDGVYEGAVTLRRHARQVCAQCGAEFAPRDGRAVCLACSKDADIVRLGHDLMRRRAATGRQHTDDPDMTPRSKLGCAQATCEHEGAR